MQPMESMFWYSGIIVCMLLVNTSETSSDCAQTHSFYELLKLKDELMIKEMKAEMRRELIEEVKELKEALKEQMLQIEKQGSGLRETNEGLKEQMLQIEKQGSELRETIEGLREEMLQIKEDAPITPFVAFTAYMTTERTYSAGERLEFDATLTDVGDNYDTTLHEFVCPLTGHYEFSWTVMTDSDDDSYISTWLYVAGTPIAQLYADTRGTWGDTYDHASRTVITRCEAGKRVYVHADNAGYVHGGAPYRRTTLSGVLLHQG